MCTFPKMSMAFSKSSEKINSNEDILAITKEENFELKNGVEAELKMSL